MRTGSARGVVASIVASVLFAVLFLLPALLEDLSPNEVLGWRVLVSAPVVAVLLLAFRRWSDVARLAHRLAAHPALILVLVLDALLLAVQMWLFGWAPQSGHGLDVSLGYLLMPLVMVVLGVVLNRERVSRLRLVAVGAAAIGVAAAVFVAGGISLPTVVVALGYPLYFVIRRRAALDGPGSLLLELVALVPVAVVLLLVAPPRDGALGADAVAGILLLGTVGGVALVLYLIASRLLSFAVFGLLSYVEPVLLVVVSVALLGESLTPLDVAVYGPILVALVLLSVESRGRPRGAG